MRFSKAITTFFLGLLVSFAFAQDRSREALQLGYIWNPDNEFQSLDAKLGVEFVDFGKGTWSGVFSIREADLELNKIDSEIHLKNYRLSLPLMVNLSSRWMLLANPGVALRTASHSLTWREENIHPSGFMMAQYRGPAGAPGWAYSLGVIYSKDIHDHFFLPIVAASYVDPPWRYNLGFPNFGVFYQSKKEWEIGLRVNFDSTTYTLPEGSALRSGSARGLRVRIIDIGPAANFKLSKHLWLNTNLGIVALAEGHTVNSGGYEQNLFYKGQTPIFLRASLSWYADYKDVPAVRK